MGKARSIQTFESDTLRNLKVQGGTTHHPADLIGGLFSNDPPAPPSIPKSMDVNGGIWKGPFGSKESILTIATGVIDVGPNTTGYARFVQVKAESGTTDDLVTIQNPRFEQQEIFLQADTGDTITIKTTGNIDTQDGTDYTLSSQKIVHLIYSILTSSWVIVGNASAGGGVSFPITPTVNDHEDTWTSPVDIDLSVATAHVNKFTLDGDLTLTFSNIPADETQIEFELEFLQDATGGHTVTFPSEVVETLKVNKGANKLTIFTLRVNDGTNVHAISTLAGTITSPSGASQTPWTEDIDADGFDLKDLSNIEFRATTGAPAGTVSYINNDASGDMVLNVATGDAFLFTINGSTQFQMNASALSLGSANLDNVSNIIFDNAATVNAGNAEISSDSSGDMNFNVATGDMFLWGIQASVQMELDTDKLRLYTDSGLSPTDLHFLNTDTTPSDADVPGAIEWTGYDSAGTTVYRYAAITGIQEDVVSTDKEGEIEFMVLHNNAELTMLSLNQSETGNIWCYVDFTPSGSGINLGNSTLDWDTLFVQNITATDLALKDGSTTSNVHLQSGDTTPTNADVVGNLIFTGDNSAAAQADYVRIEGIAQNVTSGGERGRLKIYMEKGGTEQEYFRIEDGGNFWFTADDADVDIELISDKSEVGENCTIRGSADNASGTQVEMGRIAFTTQDATAGAEIGGIEFQVQSPSGGLARGITIYGVGNAEAQLGFHNVTPISQPSITGARDDPEAALANLLTALENYGLISDSTTAT